MRSFIAIELPETIENALAELQSDLKGCGVDVRWIKPENIHLTLKFLGNIEEKMVDSISEAIKKACRTYAVMKLTLSEVGVFPNVRSPRVLWVGLNNSDILPALQNEIEQELSPLGFEQEKRKFVPHLTLGRFKSSRGKMALKEKIELYRGKELGVFDTGSVSLMKSDLGPAGAKYTRLAEIPLGDL